MSGTERDEKASVTTIRLNVIDAGGAISFIGPAHAAKVLTAACSRQPTDLGELLRIARPFDTEMVDELIEGIALFDRHNRDGDYTAIHALLCSLNPTATPPFRVVDDLTRSTSLTPVSAGLILFNLNAQRIVQVQNSYSALLRQDRGRIRAEGRPTRHLYRYVLPNEWALVP